MVQPKDKETRSWMQKLFDDFDTDHPIIATRHYVAEVTPGKQIRIANGDGHGGATYEWDGPSETQVSPYYKEESEAQAFIDTHDPDEGKTLHIRTEHKRQFITERWM